ALASACRIRGLEGLILVSMPIWGERFDDPEPAGGELVRRALRPTVARGVFDAQRRAGYRAIIARKVNSIAGPLVAKLRTPLYGDEHVGRRVLWPLRRLAARKIPVLFIQGDDNVGVEFERARAGVLGKLLRRHSDVFDVVTYPCAIHGFSSIAGQ